MSTTAFPAVKIGDKIPRVLVVEDDKHIVESIERALACAGFRVTTARSGEDAFFQVVTTAPDLVVLDLGLPGRDGLEILQAIRLRGIDCPVLVLSARADVADRIKGLQAGADDYLAKPFSIAELEVRLHVLLKRCKSEALPNGQVADLVLDTRLRRAERGKRPLNLTALEFNFLLLLFQNLHAVVSRDTLARTIWGDVDRVTSLDNVIDVHIGRIRKKVDGATAHRLIHTIRGVGFLLSDREP